MSELRKRFGRLVAAHRRRSGLTQEQLAEAAEVSVYMISKIETGTAGTRFPLIERLACALDVDPAEFFTSEIPGGAMRRKTYAALAERLALLPEAELERISRVVDAVLAKNGSD